MRFLSPTRLLYDTIAIKLSNGNITVGYQSGAAIYRFLGQQYPTRIKYSTIATVTLRQHYYSIRITLVQVTVIYAIHGKVLRYLLFLIWRCQNKFTIVPNFLRVNTYLLTLHIAENIQQHKLTKLATLPTKEVVDFRKLASFFLIFVLVF